MKSTRNPFQINIGFLINQPTGYSRAIPFDFTQFELEDELFIHQLNGVIDLIRTQDGFRSQAVFDGIVDSECGRCLEKYKEKIHSEFEEYFTFPYVDPSDDEIPVADDGNVDFAPIIHDYLLMEFPANPVCREDCKGLCDICGVNLNHEICEHDHNHAANEEMANKLDLDGAKKALKS